MLSRPACRRPGARESPGSHAGVLLAAEGPERTTRATGLARRHHRLAHLAQAPLEETSLGFVPPERDRAAVAHGRLGEAAGATEEIATRRGQEMVVDELTAGLERVEERQAVIGPVGHCDCDRPVELDHRRWSDLREHRVERDRKSTRLNSSHQIISYAVFCLK